MKLSVGTDTEFFLKNSNGSLVSATKFIEGTKSKPTILSNGGNITYDNVALEFATPPVQGEDNFVRAVEETLKESVGFLPEDIRLFMEASADFPESELNDDRCRRFGCEPDFDAWRLRINELDPEAPDKPFRSCGGHLHIGFVKDSGNDFLNDPYGKVAVIKALDIVAGIPSVILDGSVPSINRRKLYGKAGSHRPTSYGIEYRTLGNFWTASPIGVRMVHSMAEDALTLVREDRFKNLSDTITESEIIRVINEGDIPEATSFWENIIQKEIKSKTAKLFDAFKNDKEINIYSAWGL